MPDCERHTMRGRVVDDVVVGQGLAGTTLAWQLRQSGRSVLVIDQDEGVSSSSIAAGLMTPVTGQRFAKAWRWDELWPLACSFYERLEQETRRRFFTRLSMVRLFSSVEERDSFASRRDSLGKVVRAPQPDVDSTCLHNPHGGFEMVHAGRLDIPSYLQASRNHFIANNSYRTATIDPDTDVVLESDGVALPRLGVCGQRLIWCQGMSGAANPVFSSAGLRSAKGEILRLRIPGLAERRVIHCGIWLLPVGDECFLAGSTYDWDAMDGIPTPAGRAEITERLHTLLKLPIQIIGHSAAVRPTSHDFRPVIGAHPESGQTAVFNGLGSKGALYAPGLAAQLVRNLQDGHAVEREISILRWMNSSPNQTNEAQESSRPPRLTEVAHQIVGSRLQPGDFAVDATAGNGRDTLFLANCVGPEGRVAAFDIQKAALERTSDSLRRSGIGNVTLVQRDHADLADALPREMCGSLGAVMFNLGYLPGGDHAIVTKPASTIQAMRSALNELRTGGVLTVVAYPGHGGGAAETAAVEGLVRELAEENWEVGESERHGSGESHPRLYWAIHREM